MKYGNEDDRNLLTEIAEGIEQSSEIGLNVVREFDRAGEA